MESKTSTARVFLSKGNGKITVKELPPEVVFRTEKATVAMNYGGNTAGESGASSFKISTPTNLRDSEKQQIINALERTGWHRGKTAELLGISASTLYRRLLAEPLERTPLRREGRTTHARGIR